MKIQVLISILLIGLSSFDLTNDFVFQSKLTINGDWEFKKVKINGKKISASKLNNCKHRDILKIHQKEQKVKYEINGVNIEGMQMGVSNLKSCMINPLLQRYEIVNNSCPTNWITIPNSKNRIVSISESLVVEYKISKLNRSTIILTKVREIINHGTITPDRIYLKKIKKDK